MKIITRGLGGFAGFFIIRGFGSVFLKKIRHVLNFTIKVVKEVSFVFK